MLIFQQFIHIKQAGILYSLVLPFGFIFGLIFLGCKNEEGPDRPEEASHLISTEKIGTYQPETIGKRLGNISAVSLYTRFPVEVYKVVYRTVDTEGKAVNASGALVIPLTQGALPLLSIQHSTITSDRAAPSYYQSSSEVWSAGTVLASAGYVVASPDYLGYGASNQLPHPYEHRATLASAGRDLLRAVREFCKERNLRLNGQLFLSGYSEGGYATMALHQLLEGQHADEFTVTASAVGAGAYNKSAFARHILTTSQPQTYISSYLWVLQTYDDVYNLNRPDAYYLNEPYASRVEGGGITAKVETNPQKLFAPTFKEGIVSGKDTALLRVLADNDVHDWKPRAHVALFHGTSDDYVPFFNSQDAYDAMRRRGAANVELLPIKGGNHFSSVPQFALGMFSFFERFSGVAK